MTIKIIEDKVRKKILTVEISGDYYDSVCSIKEIMEFEDKEEAIKFALEEFLESDDYNLIFP